MKKRVAVLGATGSIGKNTLDVISRNRDSFDVVLLSAFRNEAALSSAGKNFPAARSVLSGGEGGKERLLRAISETAADLVVNGIAGAAGLEPSIAALDSGAVLALANKETVVMAGKLILALAAEKKTAVIPVDSEHSAVFHLLHAHNAQNGDGLKEILLTASGGPFRNYSLAEMKAVTPEAALAHPTWNMGPKITIDSASLANKGLEVIEAARLFSLPPEKIRVVIHPQSVVHSMIRLCSGEVYAQLSRPDMRHPIHAALFWPETVPADFPPLDFDSLSLEFAKPDMERFPMLDLAYHAARQGGLYPCAYNAANETAAAAFLEKKMGFLDIPSVTRHVLEKAWETEYTGLAQVLEADARARSIALSYINGINR